MKLTNSTRLSRQWAPRILCLYFPSSGITGIYHCAQLWMWVLRVWTQGLMPASENFIHYGTTPASMMRFGHLVCVKNLYLSVLYFLFCFVVIVFWPTGLWLLQHNWLKKKNPILPPLTWISCFVKKQIAVLVELILVLLFADTCLSLPWEQSQVPSYRTSLVCIVAPFNYSSHVNLKSLWISTEKLTVLFDVICIKV